MTKIPVGSQFIRVALVEDQEATREQLADLIRQQPGMQLVAAVGTVEKALVELPAHAPDVVIMDYHLPGMTGVDCVRQLHPVMKDTQFLMLTVVEEQALVFDALKAGATGYVIKGTSGERICQAVRELAAGGSPMSATIARKVVNSFRQTLPPGDGSDSLSFREEEVLGRLASGRRYKEIATDLGISDHTVRTHINHIYKKLHVSNRSEAIRSFRER